MARAETSSNIPWPPLVYGSAFLVALALTGLLPLPLILVHEPFWMRVFGGVLIVGGGVLLIWAEVTFLRAGTPTLPTSPTRAIVGGGPYAFSRNPMYLGMTLILLGIAFAADSLWFCFAALAAMLAVTRLAIEREEAYLDRKFGETYRAYREKVRRWI